MSGCPTRMSKHIAGAEGLTDPDASRIFALALPSVDGAPLVKMPRRLYAYVWSVSSVQQVRLCLLTLMVFPLSLVPIELQRRIVNDAISNGATELLLILGGIYLAALLAHGAIKYVLNVYQNRVSEGVIRRLRNRFVDTPVEGEAAGTRQAIITAEVEKLGGFVGESMSFPLLQGGMVISVVTYMLVVDPLVAIVALGFFVPSLIIVPILQQRINRLSRQRTTKVRHLSDRVGDKATSTDQAHDLIDGIYHLRVRIFLLKYFMNFANNLLGHLGPLSILMIGGWLVIQGQSELGTIVAFISGYERLMGPARDILGFYRRMSAMRIQYGMIRDAGTGN